MRILVDQNLPAASVPGLAAAGHDAVHTTQLGLERATDPEIFEVCRAQSRVLVTADKKLTKYLHETGATAPSVVIIRGFTTGAAAVFALVANLGLIDGVIAERGAAVFSLAPDKPIRVELLPLGNAVRP